MAKSEGTRLYAATTNSMQYFNTPPGCNTYYCVQILNSFHILKVKLLLPILGRGYRVAEIRDE